jgi:alkylation response protein AidB-like acyl-CoA dehydrogenase
MKDKLGLLTVKNAEIHFDNCIVPKKNLLGQKGQGLNIAYSALIDGRLSVAAGAIGVMRDCLEESVMYSRIREQHGSLLAKKQLIQEHIARIATNMESSRWLVYRAALTRQKLHDYVEKLKEEDDQWQSKLSRSNVEYSMLRNEADRLATIAKFHASNSAFDSANRAVQIFGSVAYRKTSRVARHFLDSRAIIIYEGANEVLELKMASQILGEDYRAY